jgi:glycosyltransferase involved in cell wall biosynthesis
VLHAVASVGDTWGGVAAAVASLGNIEHILGNRPTLVTLDRPEQGGSVRATLPQWFDVVAVPPGRLAGRNHGGTALARTLFRLIPGQDVVMVHCVFNFVALHACQAARWAGIPYQVQPHGSLDPYDLRKHAALKRALAPLWRWSLDGAAALVCTSSREAARLNTFGASTPRRVVALPGTPDMMSAAAAPVDPAAKSVARVRARLPAQARIALFLGRLHAEKGLWLLLDAFERVATAGDLLVIAGSGTAEFEHALLARLASCKHRDAVRFIGWVSGSAKQDLLRAADLFVLLSDKENFGFAVAEALAAGTPALLSDGVCLGDDLLSYQAAVVCPRTVEGAAHALRALLDDDAARARLAGAGRRYVIEHLAPERIAERYDQVLREVLRG